MNRILLITLLLITVFSCKDDENGIVSPDREYSPRVIQETYGNAKLVGFVNDKNGTPLADVTVFFGEEKTTTSSDGSYQLNTLSSGSNKRIWFEKDGYASTQKLADIQEELPNRIDASLFPIDKSMKMKSDGGKIEAENFSVEIEPGGFVYLDGTPVEEDVIVEATAFLTSEDEFLEAFPGEFRGTRTDGTTTAIESFGFIDVELEVESGEPVQLADGVNATIKIKAPENAPTTIPMWHYDEYKAEWIEEGTGSLNGGFYSANVSHFTPWNWDRPYNQTSKIIGRVIDNEGNPIEGAVVIQKGINFNFQNSTKTEEDGEFKLLTPESNRLEIEAFFDIYGSTKINYTTSPTKGKTNDMGDIKINISIDNVIEPYIPDTLFYITIGQTAIIKGKYFGNEKRQGYKLILNGNEVETKTWQNDLIEFDVPNGIPDEGFIQIDRDGIVSREVKYIEGDWTCEIKGEIYDNNDLPFYNGNYRIYLNDRYLGYIPNCIGNLQKLEVLKIGVTRLSSLPESIGNLINLKELDLHFNDLTSLPKSFGSLRNLEVLEIGSNKLSSLPEGFSNLNNLRELDLSLNRFSSLPESLRDLESLETLNFENNDFVSLSENIVDLENIKSLNFVQNDLKYLPENFGNLKNLEVLEIGNNQLYSLPENIGKLQNLQELWLRGNLLSTLPESIGNLQNLTELELSNNRISSLPESLGNLKNLVSLGLYKNNLIIVPESIGDLKNLESVTLERNQLSRLPESIKNLKENLNFLNLKRNNFSKEEIAKIEEWLPKTEIWW